MRKKKAKMKKKIINWRNVQKKNICNTETKRKSVNECEDTEMTTYFLAILRAAECLLVDVFLVHLQVKITSDIVEISSAAHKDSDREQVLSECE